MGCDRRSIVGSGLTISLFCRGFVIVFNIDQGACPPELQFVFRGYTRYTVVASCTIKRDKGNGA
jgi:hypothetical protein